jgi:hypothetical protein
MLDCFASLAMTDSGKDVRRMNIARLCEEQGGEAIYLYAGLLRFARNDVREVIVLIAKSVSCVFARNKAVRQSRKKEINAKLKARICIYPF